MVKRFTTHFFVNGKHEFVTCDQVVPLHAIYFDTSLIHKNCFGVFLSAFLLFQEQFSIMNMMFSVCRIRDSKSL